MSNKRKIVIVGGGFSGVTSAITILGKVSFPTEITLLEKDNARLCGGIAYSVTTAEACHETNISEKAMFKRIGKPQVMSRHAVGRELKRAFLEAASYPLNSDTTVTLHQAHATDIEDDGEHVTIHCDDGTALTADAVIVATGNHEIKELPCTRIHNDDPVFAELYIANQWDADGKKRIKSIPAHEPVAIIGTALSAYDAVRSLLRQGHTGPIFMLSRHGHEHFPYPQTHDWPDLELPRPKFLRDLFRGDQAGAVKSLLKEFEDLTRLRVNLDDGSVRKTWHIKDLFNLRSSYLPEQVLKAWEKHVPEVVSEIGAGRFGRIMKKYSSLISTLRVGAGFNISREIAEAKASGQLTKVTAGINDIAPSGSGRGLTISYKDEDGVPQSLEVSHVISSLGANQDYAATKDTLWRNLMAHGYTWPHATGIGVTLDDGGAPGALPGSKRIFAAGTMCAGHLMITKGVLGPPAFSVPGMRESIEKTAIAACNENRKPDDASGLTPEVSAISQAATVTPAPRP